MSTDSRTNHFFIYPKDKNGKHTGHTICVLLRDGRMFHGEALCGEEDQFTKSVGRTLSYQRANAEYIRDAKYRSEQLKDDGACDSDDYDPKPYLPANSCEKYERDPWEAPTQRNIKSKHSWIHSYEKYSEKNLYTVEHYQFDDHGHVGNGLEVNAHPEDKAWTKKAREKPLMELVDNGNGVDIALGDDVMRFNYGEFSDIAQLYKAWRKYVGQGKDSFKRLK